MLRSWQRTYSSDSLRAQVHEATMAAGAYPSPLNYYSFPKSVCTSVNEVRGWPQSA